MQELPANSRKTAKSHVWTKSDFCAYYGITHWLLEQWVSEIKKEIGWRTGKQTFTPTQTRLIISYLGKVVERGEY